MQIKEFKNASGRPMVEFIRTTYDPARRRGVAQRLGRFQVDAVRSADRLAVRRHFTLAEDVQFLEWWAPHQERIDGAARRASTAARAIRSADVVPSFGRAVFNIEESLRAGDQVDAAEVWRHINRLTRTLKTAGLARPMKSSTRPPVNGADDGQTDLEEHIAAVKTLMAHQAMSASA